MGAWIEIIVFSKILHFIKSLPSWERGLKSYKKKALQNGDYVAPFMGAWIEIAAYTNTSAYATSLPSWERGLKCMITA